MIDTPNYVEYRPPADGVAPPNWRKGMAWDCKPFVCDEHFNARGSPRWESSCIFHVPPEALTAPNEDDADAQFVEAWKRNEALKKLTRLGQEADIKEAVALIRKLSPDELAKHGITLAPEKDWATELWADLLECDGQVGCAEEVREGRPEMTDSKAIALIRERVVLKEGV